MVRPLCEVPQEALAALRALIAVDDATDSELAAFLYACDLNAQQAAAMRGAAKARLAELGPPTIADVAPFYRSPAPDRKHPDGCLVLLEDTKGGVARDLTWRPIIASIGMSHGSAEEMQKQMAYAMERAKVYALPEHPPHACTIVIDVVPSEAGAPVTFRFPDRDVRTLFDLQRTVFPGALFSVSHFCGLPRMVTWAFKLVRPFMSRETCNPSGARTHGEGSPREGGNAPTTACASRCLRRWLSGWTPDGRQTTRWFCGPRSRICRARLRRSACSSAGAARSPSTRRTQRRRRRIR